MAPNPQSFGKESPTKKCENKPRFQMEVPIARFLIRGLSAIIAGGWQNLIG
jgi:hypothetical protein